MTDIAVALCTCLIAVTRHCAHLRLLLLWKCHLRVNLLAVELVRLLRQHLVDGGRISECDKAEAAADVGRMSGGVEREITALQSMPVAHWRQLCGRATAKKQLYSIAQAARLTSHSRLS